MRFFKRKKKATITKREVIYRDKVITLQKQAIHKEMLAARVEIRAEITREYEAKPAERRLTMLEQRQAMRDWWEEERHRIKHGQEPMQIPEGLIEGSGY